MIRECVKNTALAKCVARGERVCWFSPHTFCRRHVMESPAFYTLLAYTDVAVFEVASDAFLAFKARGFLHRCFVALPSPAGTQELLSRHGALTTAFLLDNSPKFFTEFNSKLLLSKNYVTKRQSLKVRLRVMLRMAALTRVPAAAAWGAAADAGERGGDDAVHQRRGAPHDHHAAAARLVSRHPVRGVPHLQGVCGQPEQAGTGD
jgi:hypothetical protein